MTMLKSKGFTLIELIVGLSLSVIIVFTAWTVFRIAVREHKRSSETASAHMQLTLGMEKIKAEIKSDPDSISLLEEIFYTENDCLYEKRGGSTTLVIGPLSGLAIVFEDDDGYLTATLLCDDFSLSRQFAERWPIPQN